MRIINEDNAVLEITEDQFMELENLGAINDDGFWLEDGSDLAWTILAIGLDQVPGEFGIEITEDERVLN
jgi:hypothetical protein